MNRIENCNANDITLMNDPVLNIVSFSLLRQLVLCSDWFIASFISNVLSRVLIFVVMF